MMKQFKVGLGFDLSDFWMGVSWSHRNSYVNLGGVRKYFRFTTVQINPLPCVSLYVGHMKELPLDDAEMRSTEMFDRISNAIREEFGSDVVRVEGNERPE